MPVKPTESVYQSEEYDLYRYKNGVLMKLYRSGADRSLVKKEYDKACAAVKAGAAEIEILDFVQFNERFGFLLSDRYGSSLTDLLVSAEDPDQVRSAAESLAREYARIHGIHVVLPCSADSALSSDIRYNSFLSSEEKYRILDLYYEMPRDVRICLGNPCTDHMLLSEGRIVFTDWCNSMTGHPLCDIAALEVYLKYTDAPISPDTRTSFLEAFFEAYFRDSDYERSMLDAFRLPIMVSLLYEMHSHLDRESLLLDVKNASRSS